MLDVNSETLAKPPGRDNRHRRSVPRLLLLTDETRLPDPSAAVRRLPAGSAVILRHTDPAMRARLAARLLRLCRRHRVRLLIADDARLARRLGADGLHLPERRLWSPRPLQPPADAWVTASAHDDRALRQACRRHVDAVLLAPVQATASHPGRRPMGRSRFARLATRADMPVVALGGVGPNDAAWIRAAGGSGIAGIGALADAGTASLRRAVSVFFPRRNWCRTRTQRSGRSRVTESFRPC